MTNGFNYLAAIDAGNGYMKAWIQNYETGKSKTSVFPSVAAKRRQLTLSQPLEGTEIEAFATGDVINQMDIAISSPLVKEPVRRLFANGALTSGQSMEQFDVYSPISKAEVDLSGSLVLGTIAARVLKDYWAEHQGLPDEPVKAKVILSTALPIEEHKKFNKAYKKNLLNNGKSHRVSFYNFEDQVHIDIMFKDVHIANEGESAQYGLMYASSDFLDVIERNMRENYPDGELDEILAADIVNADNSLVIDIGEGTTDFAVFTEGKFNIDASSTMSKGFGNVLEQTLDELHSKGMPYSSRKQLSELLHVERTSLNRRRIEAVEREVEEQTYQFAGVVTDEVGKVFSRVGGFIDVIYVIGGGAGAMQDALFPLIKDRVNEFNMGHELPIIYLDGGYSRFLNVQGLTEIAKLMAG